MQNNSLPRRRMMSLTGKSLFLGLFCGGVIHTTRAYATLPKCEILGYNIIPAPADLYYGWPTLAQRQGELLVVASGGREEHVCPFGRVDLFRSKDGGKSWTWPQTVYDGPTDDRDAGILVTSKGTILVTTFTSLAYEPSLHQEAALQKEGKGKWDTARFARWNAVDIRLSDDEKKKELGCWAIRSTDGGITWSARMSTIFNSPHGPIQLADGRLIYPGKDLWGGTGRIGVAESCDDGMTWKVLSDIPVREGDDLSGYHELHGVEATNGRIIVQIRNHCKANAGETLQTESEDGGKTWTPPHSIGVWGLPSFLMKLRDGRLLMTYGHRRPPLGNQMRVSENNGTTWSEPLLLSQDGTSGDLGYPSTVQLADGTLCSVWYEKMANTPKAVLRVAHWSLG